MDLKTVEFAVFCIENIILHYDILHTQGRDYIIDDIIEYMKTCEVIV